ncbi:MAG: complex I subunit 5 family protein [Spirochaetota bacterium]
MSNPVALIILPFAGALFGLFGKVLHGKRLWSILSVLPLAGMATLLVGFWPDVQGGEAILRTVGGWGSPIAIPISLDGFAWLSSALVVVISSMVALAAFSNDRYGPTFFFFFMLLIAGMEAVVLTRDLFTMFVAFEIVAIAAYVLIAFDQTDAGLLASLKYLMLSSVGILFFLLGVFIVYREFGTLSLDLVAARLVGSEPTLQGAIGTGGSRAVPFAIAALCVGVGVRTAFIPFHTWLPEAHAYAPHPVSAILSGVLIKVSLFAMIRIIAVFGADYFSELLVWIGAVTALAAVIWALAQSDGKRLLAYHSISQMGYVVAAFGTALPLSPTAGVSHAINHALFKSLLFLVVGSAISMTGERDLYKAKPIGRAAPILALMLVVGALSIGGIPPFNGYTSKALISQAMSGRTAYLFLQIAAVGTVASFIKLGRIALPGRRLSELGSEAPKRAGLMIHIPTLALGALCLLAGLFWRPLSATYAALLSQDAAQVSTLPDVFSTSKLIDALIIVTAGIALYFLVVSKPGKASARVIKRIAPELRTVLLFFVFGFALFAIFAYVQPAW